MSERSTRRKRTRKGTLKRLMLVFFLAVTPVSLTGCGCLGAILGAILPLIGPITSMVTSIVTTSIQAGQAAQQQGPPAQVFNGVPQGAAGGQAQMVTSAPTGANPRQPPQVNQGAANKDRNGRTRP